MNKTWTDTEKAFVRDNAHKLTDQQISKILSDATGKTITMLAVRKQRQKMGIKKGFGRGVCEVTNKSIIKGIHHDR